MGDTISRARLAIGQTQATVDRVCGACENSCCHQGTMMGTHDLLRLVKGMRAEPGRERIVREGLKERAAELRADLRTLQSVRGLIAAADVADKEAALEALDRSLDEWEQLCDFMEGPWSPEAEDLRRVLRFAGVWAIALRALSGMPGGHAALSTLAQEGASFKFRGRRLAPPRCIFHSLAQGCLAGRWKPGKCANFFCSGEPNVLHELREAMDFEEFVLGNGAVVNAEQALDAVRVELSLGREFVEPKVFIGLDKERTTELRGILDGGFERIVEPLPRGGRFMLSSAEVDRLLTDLEPNEACVVEPDVIDGFALYELGIALDRRRAAGEAVALVVAAREFAALSAMPHPLWADAEMSQPLGVLDIYVVAGG